MTHLEGCKEARRDGSNKLQPVKGTLCAENLLYFKVSLHHVRGALPYSVVIPVSQALS